MTSGRQGQQVTSPAAEAAKVAYLITSRRSRAPEPEFYDADISILGQHKQHAWRSLVAAASVGG